MVDIPFNLTYIVCCLLHMQAETRRCAECRQVQWRIFPYI